MHKTRIRIIQAARNGSSVLMFASDRAAEIGDKIFVCTSAKGEKMLTVWGPIVDELLISRSDESFDMIVVRSPLSEVVSKNSPAAQSSDDELVVYPAAVLLFFSPLLPTPPLPSSLHSMLTFLQVDGIDEPVTSLEPLQVWKEHQGQSSSARC
eukprot:759452-Hanusia_phi.AAC.6